MKTLSIIILIFLIASPDLATAACSTFTVSASPQTTTAGSPVTLSATVSGCGSVVDEVDFYNGTAGLCSAQNPTITTPGGVTTYGFSCTWTPSTTGPVTVKAEAIAAGAGTYPNMSIDLVGDTSLATAPAPIPTKSASFGANAIAGNGAAKWLEGDNQVCSVNWPYNGFNVAYPDGSCEWMNQANIKGTTNVPVTTTGTNTTIDGPDEAMHIMADFAKFANSLQTVTGGALAAGVNNWYPQAAGWIAPACAGTADACSSQGFDEQTCSSTASCNQGSLPGRLLTLYEPHGYPGITNYPNYTGPTVDVFGNWNSQVITPWLNNVYASASAWCVPMESALTTAGTITYSPAEDTYITSSANTAPTSCSDNSTCGDTTKGQLAGQCLNGNACSKWGDLSHVIACLNYYAAPASANYGAAQAYQNCLNYLVQQTTCPTSFTGTACDPATLGRTLVTGDVNAHGVPQSVSGSNNCDPSYTGSFAKYVKDSLTVFNDEAPKFALRSAYLTDVYNRATSMQNIFNQAHTALGNFFKPCDSCSDGSTCSFTAGTPGQSGKCATGGAVCNSATCPNGSACTGYVAPTSGTAGSCSDGSACGSPSGACEDGGPAAQLIYGRNLMKTSTADPLKKIPNAVIYGWVDKAYPNGHPGYAHIVKVVAFSPGRGGAAQMGSTLPGFIHPLLPWINTWETWALRKFALADRDGYVYVDIKRWDEDHGSCDNGNLCVAGSCGDGTSCGPILFPNQHTLWQFLFHSPVSTNTPSITGNGLITDCNGLALSGGAVGYGLLPETIAGLNIAMSAPPTSPGLADSKTLTALQNAFMLNDEGDGAIDPTVLQTGNGEPCSGSGSSPYCLCLYYANLFVNEGIESQACAQYIAAGHDKGAIQSGSSSNGDSDYALKFVDCKNLPYFKETQLDDLMSPAE